MKIVNTKQTVVVTTTLRKNLNEYLFVLNGIDVQCKANEKSKTYTLTIDLEKETPSTIGMIITPTSKSKYKLSDPNQVIGTMSYIMLNPDTGEISLFPQRRDAVLLRLDLLEDREFRYHISDYAYTYYE